MPHLSFHSWTGNSICVLLVLYALAAAGGCSRGKGMSVRPATPDASPGDGQVDESLTVDQRQTLDGAAIADAIILDQRLESDQSPGPDLLVDLRSPSDSPGDGDLTDSSGTKDVVSGEVPSCVSSGGLSFSRPQVLPGVNGEKGVVMAATADRNLVAVGGTTEGVGTYYVDSLDGGRSFRSPVKLSGFGPDNLNLAVGSGGVYATSASFAAHTSVFLWYAPLGLGPEPPSFQAIELNPIGAYFGNPVPGPNGRIAVLLGYDTWDSSGGEMITTAFQDLVFSSPHKLFWPEVCAAGIYHSNGSLYIAYGLDTTNGPIMEIRWSSDGGTTFTEPVRRTSSGGDVWCPKMYELPDGNLLLANREGYALNPPQRTVAVTFDVAGNQFYTQVIIDQGDIVCSDSARTAAGRLYVSATFGDPGDALQGVNLRYSDDGGSSWSAPYSIPGMAITAGCPELAASSDELYILWREGSDFLLSRAGGATACD